MGILGTNSVVNIQGRIYVYFVISWVLGLRGDLFCRQAGQTQTMVETDYRTQLEIWRSKQTIAVRQLTDGDFQLTLARDGV